MCQPDLLVNQQQHPLFQITPVLVNNIKPKLFVLFLNVFRRKRKKSDIQFIQKYPNETNICKNAKNASEYAHKPNIFGLLGPFLAFFDSQYIRMVGIQFEYSDYENHSNEAKGIRMKRFPMTNSRSDQSTLSLNSSSDLAILLPNRHHLAALIMTCDYLDTTGG